MQSSFDWRAALLVVFLGAVLLWFAFPVARIDSATCDQIRPGMTKRQVQEVIGAPPGNYDGVTMIWSDAPSYKVREIDEWVGFRGKILIRFGGQKRVTWAKFYSGRVNGWDLGAFVWERFTRVQYRNDSLTARLALHWTLANAVLFILGFITIHEDARNPIALYGLLGLVVGPILSIAIFSDQFSMNWRMTLLVLSSPIQGAIAGVFVGFVRSRFAKPSTHSPGNDVATTATTAQ